jgi:S1-C subfamily serine protease
LKVNNVAVASAADVQEQVENSEVGELVAVEVQRGEDTEVVQVRPTAYPQN